MNTIKENVKKFICDNLLGVDTSELNDTDSLFKEKRLDSLSLGELLTFVEKSFKFKIAPLEITFENFDSIDLLSNYIQTKIKN